MQSEPHHVQQSAPTPATSQAVPAQPKMPNTLPKDVGQSSSEEKKIVLEDVTQKTPMEIEPKSKQKVKWCFYCRNRGYVSAECVAELSVKCVRAMNMSQQNVL